MKHMIALPLPWWVVAKTKDFVCSLTTYGEHGEIAVSSLTSSKSGGEHRRQ